MERQHSQVSLIRYVDSFICDPSENHKDRVHENPKLVLLMLMLLLNFHPAFFNPKQLPYSYFIQFFETQRSLRGSLPSYILLLVFWCWSQLSALLDGDGESGLVACTRRNVLDLPHRKHRGGVQHLVFIYFFIFRRAGEKGYRFRSLFVECVN